jgi:hypothetical protein
MIAGVINGSTMRKTVGQPLAPRSAEASNKIQWQLPDCCEHRQRHVWKPKVRQSQDCDWNSKTWTTNTKWRHQPIEKAFFSEGKSHRQELDQITSPKRKCDCNCQHASNPRACNLCHVNPRGTAKTTQTSVTAIAIPRVLMEVEKYAGTEKMSTKLLSVNPGMTLEVYGSINQKAVTSKSASEIM